MWGACSRCRPQSERWPTRQQLATKLHEGRLGPPCLALCSPGTRGAPVHRAGPTAGKGSTYGEDCRGLMGTREQPPDPRLPGWSHAPSPLIPCGFPHNLLAPCHTQRQGNGQGTRKRQSSFARFQKHSWQQDSCVRQREGTGRWASSCRITLCSRQDHGMCEGGW